MGIQSSLQSLKQICFLKAILGCSTKCKQTLNAYNSETARPILMKFCMSYVADQYIILYEFLSHILSDNKNGIFLIFPTT